MQDPASSDQKMCDLILFNANAITMDPAQPFAQLIAVERGKIKAVSGNEMLSVLKSRKTRTVDCAGRTLLPGFIDAHCHVHGYAETLVSLDLSPQGEVVSISDIQNRIREFCSILPPGTWVRGKGYDEFCVAEKRHPNRLDLDAAAPLHPVKLTHRSGHAHVLNSLALKLAAIDAETGDPPGGMIDRHLPDGSPTGILYGLGAYLAEKIPPLDEPEMGRGIGLAGEKLLSYGITSVQDASIFNGPDHWKRFEAWKKLGKFQPRLTMMTGWSAFSNSDPESYSTTAGLNELRLGSVKIIADEVTGSLHPNRQDLFEAIASIHAAGRQAAIHAIEEPVIEAAADAIEFAMGRSPRQNHRHRIEHCSVCRPAVLKRLAGLGVVVVTQPSFIYYSGDRYLQTVPEDQLEYLYPVRSMLQNGLHPAAGSDFPIADPNPLVSICAAVTRQTRDGAVIPQQRIDVMDALRMHTINAAAAGFEEMMKGSLSPGKLADIVVLSENPLEVDSDRIRDIEVLMTVLNGKVVFTEPRTERSGESG
jgi:predicted amidohydrolase YtcJ